MSYNSEKKYRKKWQEYLALQAEKENLARMKREERTRIKEEKKLKIKLVRLEYKKKQRKKAIEKKKEKIKPKNNN